MVGRGNRHKVRHPNQDRKSCDAGRREHRHAATQKELTLGRRAGAQADIDQPTAALIKDLKERGLLDSTLVVMAGEFGRTPRISRGASAIGRDHWPNCYSAMLAGAGIPGGTVYGASDETAAWEEVVT